MVYLLVGPGGSSDYVPPPSSSVTSAGTVPWPTDPASEAKLSDYETGYAEAMKIPALGARCERLAEAFAPLTADDISRAMTVVKSTRSRAVAVRDGQNCRRDLTASDRHYDTLLQAVAAAQSNPTAQTLQAASSALAALDAFDKSRTRYKTDASIIAQAEGFARDLKDSDTKIAALVEAATAYQNDRSPELAVRAADARAKLRDLDRSRLSASQQPILAVADEAIRTVRDSRARLARLERLWTGTQERSSPDFQQKLIDAIGGITPFDREIATPDQLKLLDEASSAAAADAWSIARQRLVNLAQDPNPVNYQSVAAIYQVLRILPQGNLSDEQKQIFSQVETAAGKVAASDAHLQALLQADADWRQQRLGASDSILKALHDIRDFDSQRFQDAHREAMARLKNAAVIIHGPEAGLNAATKATTPIFVISSGRANRGVADAIMARLRQEHFLIAGQQNDAALIADVSVKSVSDKTAVYNGTSPTPYVASAELSSTFSWASDGSELTTCDRTSTVRGNYDDDLTWQAMQQAIRDVVNCLETATGTAQPLR